MSGYLRSTNPIGTNRRIREAFALLDRYENTEAYQAYRSRGFSIRAALKACEEK